MDFRDVIGFFVTLAAIAYMFIKRVRDARNRPDPSPEEDEHGERLEDFLKSLEEDMEESKDFKPIPKPLPKPKIVKPPTEAYAVKKSKPPKQPHKEKEDGFRSTLDGYTSHSSIEDRKLKTNIKSLYEGDYGEHLLSKGFRSDGKDEVRFVGLRGSSRAKKLLRSLPSKKDMILINEIFNKPKGLN